MDPSLEHLVLAKSHPTFLLWKSFIRLPKSKSQPQLCPTVPVRNPLLIRRISKKVTEKEKQKNKSNSQISAPVMLESPIGIKVECLPGSHLA